MKSALSTSDFAYCVANVKEEALLPDERKQLSKIFPLSFCNSDSIEAPAGKDETQKSSVSHNAASKHAISLPSIQYSIG